jgi:hypothetical protein
MKKTLIFSLLASALMFTSCTKDAQDKTIATPTTVTKTPKELIIGIWAVTSSSENLTDSQGSILSSRSLPLSAVPSLTSLQADGKYFTYSHTAAGGSGTWELSTDSKKIIYDKGSVDERYYKITELTETKWLSIGPYKLNDAQYFSGKLYEYGAKK